MLARKDFFRSMRVLQVSIQKQLEAFALQVSFVLASHGITVLWGASGSGKTTLLQCLAGLLRPDAGRIACREAVWFDAERGVCLAPERRRLGYVFQDVRLFPHLSVRSNMLFGRRFRGPSGVSFEDVVALLGLGRLLHRTPSDLSGGEKQRVAVGRALLACPAAHGRTVDGAGSGQTRRNHGLRQGDPGTVQRTRPVCDPFGRGAPFSGGSRSEP